MQLLEVEFKGQRKGVFSNPQEFPLQKGDRVVIRADRGEDLGIISLIGPEWEEILTPKQPEDGEQAQTVEPVLRLASSNDIEAESLNRKTEREARDPFFGFIKQHELEMKLVDAEYQLDKKKLTFYFTADGRVDFRGLVKDLANHFKTRIDLRQIGARDESKRLGGIGICGRELCCSTWIREFQPVTTAMVKEQYLLLNPQKNTGLCGRLRCCLRYEVDQYRNVNLLFPKLDTKVSGPRGNGNVEKIDMCTTTCGIYWMDGTRVAYTVDQMKEFSDWNPETSDKKGPIVFKADPSQFEVNEPELVASSAPTEHKEMVSELAAIAADRESKLDPDKERKGGRRGSNRNKRGKGRRPQQKQNQGSGEKQAKHTSTPDEDPLNKPLQGGRRRGPYRGNKPHRNKPKQGQNAKSGEGSSSKPSSTKTSQASSSAGQSSKPSGKSENQSGKNAQDQHRRRR